MLGRLACLCIFVVGCATSTPEEPERRAEGRPPPTAGDKHLPLEPLSAQQSGTIALGAIGEQSYAFVADADDDAVIVVDADTLTEVRRHPLAGRPEHLLLSGDGHIYVSVASTGQVAKLAMTPAGMVTVAEAEVAAEPAGMALTSGGTLLVASRWGAALTVLDAAALRTRHVVHLPRDPYTVTLLEDESRAVVSHIVGGRLSVVDFERGNVSELDATRFDQKLPRSKKGWRGDVVEAHRVAVQAFAATRVGDGRIVVPASLADGSPAVGFGFYGGGSSDIKPHAGVELMVAHDGAALTVPRGLGERGVDCLQPRGAAWDPGTKLLYVACMGKSQLHAVTLDHHEEGKTAFVGELPDGPTGIALDVGRRRWVAWSQFAARITRGSLDDGDVTMSAQLQRRNELPLTVLRGRTLFHTAGVRPGRSGRACASCHPGGRDDGITWHTPNGPRQTPILVERIGEEMAPFGWNGRMKEVDEHIHRTIVRLEAFGVTNGQRADLATYVRHLRRPQLRTEPQALAKRGQQLFTEDGRCSSCHPLGTTTDGGRHEFYTHTDTDISKTFNTPSLRAVSKSAPYYHDGRYATLDALLADPGTGMGTHADLAADDRHALLAFLQTL